jgi:hypothetical protein
MLTAINNLMEGRTGPEVIASASQPVTVVASSTLLPTRS